MLKHLIHGTEVIVQVNENTKRNAFIKREIKNGYIVKIPEGISINGLKEDIEMNVTYDDILFVFR